MMPIRCPCYQGGPTVRHLGACQPCVDAWLAHRLTLPRSERFEPGPIPVRLCPRPCGGQGSLCTCAATATH